MEKRLIGDSKIEVAPFALGGNVFDWTADEAASFAVIDAFVDGGGNMIDTADVYSAWVPGHKGGESEALIGRWLKRDPGKREKVIIATKVGIWTARSSSSVRDGAPSEVIARACDDFARRLGIEGSTYITNTGRQNVPLESSSERSRPREQRKIRTVGISNFTGPGSMRRSTARNASASTKPAALQPKYNWSSATLRGRAAATPQIRTALVFSLTTPRKRLSYRQIPKQGRPRQKHSRGTHRRLSRRQWYPRA